MVTPYFLDNPFSYFPERNDLSKEAKERFETIKKLLEEKKDHHGIQELKHLLDAAVTYINVAVNHIAQRQVLKMEYGAESRYYQEEENEIERIRKCTHNDLISRLHAFNRYLAHQYKWETDGGLIPAGGIFTLEHHLFGDRKRIGDWAWLLVSGLYHEEMRKHQDHVFT